MVRFDMPLLPLSDGDYRKFVTLGELVCYRPKEGFLMEEWDAAFVVNAYPNSQVSIDEYEEGCGLVDLRTLAGQYLIARVPYSKNLASPNTWCFRKDVKQARKHQKANSERVDSGPESEVASVPDGETAKQT